MSSQLSFTSHIRQIVDKACSKAAWCLSVFRSRDKVTMLTLFKSIVRPHLEYCCPLWHPSKVADIQSIESIQRSFTSKIHGLENLNYWERLSELNLMSLQRRRERYCIIYLWKILYSHAPNDIGIQWNVNFRLGIKALVPRAPRNRKIHSIYEASFAINAPRLWNTLPKKVNCEHNFEVFKHLLDNFLLSFPDEPPTTGYASRCTNSILSWSSWRF